LAGAPVIVPVSDKPGAKTTGGTAVDSYPDGAQVISSRVYFTLFGSAWIDVPRSVALDQKNAGYWQCQLRGIQQVGAHFLLAAQTIGLHRFCREVLPPIYH